MTLRWATGIFMVVGAVLASAGAPNADTPNIDKSSIRVNFSTAKEVYSEGEDVVARYSVENIGKAPFYVHRSMPLVTGAHSGFTIQTTPDLPNELAIDVFFVGYPEKTPIDTIVGEQWLLLHPGMFYGRSTTLFFRTAKAGRYRLDGQYFDNTPSWLSESQREGLKKLKHPVALGWYKAEPVWIEVRR